jgi:hypothetical protein
LVSPAEIELDGEVADGLPVDAFVVTADAVGVVLKGLTEGAEGVVLADADGVVELVTDGVAEVLADVVVVLLADEVGVVATTVAVVLGPEVGVAVLPVAPLANVRSTQ